MAAINPFEETAIITATPRKQSGADWLAWGDGNKYPHYVRGLYDDCPTLQAVIEGFVTYGGGNGVHAPEWAADEESVNVDGQTLADLIADTLRSIAIWGGFAWEVHKNPLTGAIKEIYARDCDTIRTNEDNSVFWYSEDFAKGGRAAKPVTFPKFSEENAAEVSIFYAKVFGNGVYPVPCYAAAVKACEVERNIDTFHLNEINNGFMGSYLVNFNNGFADDEAQEEIERTFNEKFSGSRNAGRIVFSWNEDKEHAATLTPMNIHDYGDKYETLAKHCRQAIFTAFHANPNLFGIPTENNGFSNEQYAESFALYNRTQVRPIQNKIAAAFKKVTGERLIIDHFAL